MWGNRSLKAQSFKVTWGEKKRRFTRSYKVCFGRFSLIDVMWLSIPAEINTWIIKHSCPVWLHARLLLFASGYFCAEGRRRRRRRKVVIAAENSTRLWHSNIFKVAGEGCFAWKTRTKLSVLLLLGARKRGAPQNLYVFYQTVEWVTLLKEQFTSKWQLFLQDFVSCWLNLYWNHEDSVSSSPSRRFSGVEVESFFFFFPPAFTDKIQIYIYILWWNIIVQTHTCSLTKQSLHWPSRCGDVKSLNSSVFCHAGTSAKTTTSPVNLNKSELVSSCTSCCKNACTDTAPAHVYVIYKNEMINDEEPGVCPPTLRHDASRLR